MGGRRWPDIWIPRPRFAYSLYNFYGAPMTIKGSLHVSIAIVKAFLADFWSRIWLGHVTCRRWPHIWIPWPQLAYSLYNFHWATMTIKGSLQTSIPIIKAFLREILSHRKLAKNLRFRGKMWSKCKISFSRPPKGTSVCETTSFDVLIVKSVQVYWL